ncbi:MAG TPA: PAS domain-containing protein, partial [Chloroflexota bacterium]
MKRKSGPRLMSRLASAGLALVLLLLASVSLWSSYATQVVADHVTQASRGSVLYKDIRKDFDAASTAQLAYRAGIGPSPTLRARFNSSTDEAHRSLRSVIAGGVGNDRASTQRLVTLLGQYEATSRIFFTAVDAGDRNRATELEDQVLIPLIHRMDALESLAQSRERSQVYSTALSAGASAGAIRTFVAVSSVVGLALIACFALLLRTYQRRIEMEEQKHRTLVEQLPVAAYMGPVDAHGPMTYVGREIESILGYSRAEWLGNRELWATLLHPEDRTRVLDERQRHLDQ